MLVSILIPCHNAEEWVAQAIESALSQTWFEKEVIVVDDGSTDGTLDEIRKFEGRILWETRSWHGANAARNRLLELARGTWLQYLDADDYLEPGKVAAQMKCVETSPDVDVVFSPVTLEHQLGFQVRREELDIRESHDPWLLLARWSLPQTGAALWRTDPLIDVGAWRIDQPCCQEHELYLRLLMAGKKFVYCASTGAIYRQFGKDTLSTRDIAELHRRRLDIERQAESFLRDKGRLTPERRRAINDARFETARIAWTYDKAFATKVMNEIRHSDPGFIPHGNAAKLHYQLAYRAFGFQGAEHLAGLKRRLARSSA
jgi:glycosyltransferase involved in cell wall biosynthesis